MNYTNCSIRRQDRLLSEDNASKLLRHGEYGILSMQAEEGGGYGVPINYVWNGHNAIYLHCAPEGRKLRCLERDNRVSFCIVGHTKVIPEKFTTGYESIVLQGTAHTHLAEQERMQALLLLVDKYSPHHKENGTKYAEKSLAHTLIIRLDMDEWSGKCKNVG
ncbi:MAG: pyridoxamine 5'-phosphate oxidase family protein [Breznakibacter sp.]